jgi:hypothetical protein
LAAYASPPATSALADLSHGAYHAYEVLAERQARAAALGLVHLHAEPPARSVRAGDFVHEHGGEPHAHAPTVDVLLAASEDVDDEREHAAPTLVEFTGHLPGGPAGLTLIATRAHAVYEDQRPSPPDRSLRPPLPPPRA